MEINIYFMMYNRQSLRGCYIWEFPNPLVGPTAQPGAIERKALRAFDKLISLNDLTLIVSQE